MEKQQDEKNNFMKQYKEFEASLDKLELKLVCIEK